MVLVRITIRAIIVKFWQCWVHLVNQTVLSTLSCFFMIWQADWGVDWQPSVVHIFRVDFIVFIIFLFSFLFLRYRHRRSRWSLAADTCWPGTNRLFHLCCFFDSLLFGIIRYSLKSLGIIWCFLIGHPSEVNVGSKEAHLSAYKFAKIWPRLAILLQGEFWKSGQKKVFKIIPNNTDWFWTITERFELIPNNKRSVWFVKVCSGVLTFLVSTDFYLHVRETCYLYDR